MLFALSRMVLWEIPASQGICWSYLPRLAQVCRLERATHCKDRATVEIQYAISNLRRERADAAFLLTQWRGHWGIENRLHWVRDVSLDEDKCQVKKGHGPHN
jgi:hypothetical protein